jgi:polyhydroxyalkanoate synthesis regulator phasin
MRRMKILPILLVSALAIAAAVGVVAYQSANASTPKAAELASKLDVEVAFGRGFGGAYNNEYLADALGITVDELNAAIQEAKQAALDQAVKDGLITQAQADEITSRGTALPFAGRWDNWLSRNGIDFNAFLAGALGISVEDLQAAYAEAYSARIDQAVTDGRLTQEQADLMKGRYALFTSEKFQSSLQSAFEEAVSQAVSDGVITQAQADQILENQKGFGLDGFRGFDGFDGMGRGHGGGFGRHGGPGEDVPGESTPAEPSATPSGGV